MTRPLVPYVRRPDWPTHVELVDALRSELPECDVEILADIPDTRLDEITVAIVDGPDAAQLASIPNLGLVQSTWAGVERVLPAMPGDVALARMIDPQLGFTMAEAVLAWTLYLHREMPVYAAQQRAHDWTQQPSVRAEQRRVGVLGLGVLGELAATTLVDQRFAVSGWSRAPKDIRGVRSLHGDGGFDELLATSDIVVNLLPHTDATCGLLDATAFARMPAGSSVINFGRGPTVVDADLLDALDRHHLEHAVLDVFNVEPLPDDHPFWDHPRVTVLPHISGPTTPDTAAVIAAANVRRFLADGTLPADAVVDPDRGY